jgi:hypothetical protein
MTNDLRLDLPLALEVRDMLFHLDLLQQRQQPRDTHLSNVRECRVSRELVLRSTTFKEDLVSPGDRRSVQIQRDFLSG